MKTTTLIVRDKDIMSGTPVIAGSRVPVRTLFDYLEAGDDLAEFFHDLPSVRRDIVVELFEDFKRIVISVPDEAWAD